MNTASPSPPPSCIFKDVQRRNDQKALSNFLLPYENYIGSVLGGQFRLGPLIRKEPGADVYTVQALDGTYQGLEAKAFSLNDISKPELRTRKRCMKKLEPKQICQVDQAGRKFIVYCADGISRQELLQLTAATRGSRDVKVNTKSAASALKAEDGQRSITIAKEIGNTKCGQKKRKRKRGLRKSKLPGSDSLQRPTQNTSNEYFSFKGQIDGSPNLEMFTDSDEISWRYFRSTDLARISTRGKTNTGPAYYLPNIKHQSNLRWRSLLLDMYRNISPESVWNLKDGSLDKVSPT